MTLPKLSESQLEGLLPQVAEYIESQRRTYQAKATPLNANQKAVMAPFFRQSVLDAARVVVLTDARVSNPPFYGKLLTIGFDLGSLPNFTHMAAITFVDTIVSHVPIANRILFHELVHVVQYDKLGLAKFVAKYVRGFLTSGSFEEIPLERNAYELDTRFAAAPRSAFSVEDVVQELFDGGLF